MGFDADDLFENVVVGLLPLWGPFYAVFYILRTFWNEIFRRNE